MYQPQWQRLHHRGPVVVICLLALLFAAIGFPLLSEDATGRAAPSAEQSGHVKRSSSAIAITGDGRMLLAVNPDSDSLSIVDLDDGPAVTEIPVGADPRTVAVSDDGTRAYTANRAGNSVSVVDVAGRAVVADLAVGARPYGVVVSPDGHTLYVAVQGEDRLAVLDTASLRTVLSMPLPDRPSGLALAANGETLYVTHLLHNAVTRLALPLSSLYLPFLAREQGAARPAPDCAPDRPPAGRARPQQAAGATCHAALDQAAAASTITLFPDSNLVQAMIIAPDGERAYVPHTRSKSSNRALTLDTTVAPLVSVVDLPAGRHLVGEQFNMDIVDPPAVGLPFDAALTPAGDELWVVNAASNDVTVIDLATGERAAHVEVGDNPRGIVIAPDGGAAYVNDTLAGAVSVLDTTTYTVTAVIPVTSIPLDPVLLTGKRLFHSSDDARMGKDQWMSCNTCHFDGEHDGQTWFLGFAGPRNTSSLLGMGQTLPLRWSGEWDEAADSEFAIRMDSFGTGLVDGDMRCSLDPPDCVNHPPHAGASAELDALAAYINSLSVPPSPSRPLSEAVQRGQDHFHDPAVGCAACHPAPLYTDNLLHDVGTATADERIGPAFNTPSLRGVYHTAPYFHDGSAATLYEAVTRPAGAGEHDVTAVLTGAEIEDLVAFLLSLP